MLSIGIGAPTIAAADEGGVSFWLPGLFGSLAAAPQQPGWSLTTIYWHDSVSAGADVGRAREFTIGNIPVSASANLSARLSATLDLVLIVPTYVFASPVLGGQVAVGLMGIYGRESASLAGTLSGTLGTPFGAISFLRSPTIGNSVTGFGDLYPQAFLRWNAGVNNYMVYMTGDIPVGAYDSTRLSNIGIGHGAVDGGAGYTYFDPKTGHEFSGVLGFTYNGTNPSTQYKSGVDMHLDWGASQFLTKQLQVGVVGYVYDEIGCDSGVGDRVGCFQSRVVGRRTAARLHHSPRRDAGLCQPEGLRGIRRPEPSARLEYLAHRPTRAGTGERGAATVGRPERTRSNGGRARLKVLTSP